MESVIEPGAAPAPRYKRGLQLEVVIGSGAVGIALLATASAVFAAAPPTAHIAQTASSIVAITGCLLTAIPAATLPSLLGIQTAGTAERARLLQAEQNLADVAQAGSQATTEALPSTDGVLTLGLQEQLTLLRLWQVTHRRLDVYHRIVTRQATRSFIAAQAAIVIGFAVLVVAVLLASKTRSLAGTVTAAALGAASAALAGYISRTFVRSQESAASHLRAYFDQPLEFSKYLAAERLLATNADLDDEKRAAMLSALIQAMVQ